MNALDSKAWLFARHDEAVDARMSRPCDWEHCPAPVCAQISVIRDGILYLLRKNTVGIYLHGSLALGCFNPERSDIDLLVVTRRKMDPATKADVGAFLLTNSAPYWPPKIKRPVEISFLCWADLHPWQYPTPYDFHFSENHRSFFVDLLRDDPRIDPDMAAHVAITRQFGINLHGLRPDEVFPDVPDEDYLEALLYDIETLETDILKFPHYAVLSACRVLAYVQEKRITSKDSGAEWALATVPAEHHAVIRQALALYRGDGEDATFNPSDLTAFADYIRSKIP